MSKVNDKKWVVYPTIPLTVDDIKKHIRIMQEKEIELTGTLLPELGNIVDTTLVEEISTIEDAEVVGDEQHELTDEEKKKQFIEALKKARKGFNPIKTVGNVTTNQFGSAYKKKRSQKNKQAKKSRKINRK